MKRKCLPMFVLGFSLAAAGQSAPVGPSAETSAALERLNGLMMLHNPAYEYDRQLADEIGPRLTGSANYVKATEWAEKEFTRLGLKNVHKESWTIPATWEPEVYATARVLAPHEQRLHLESEGWSPSTPEDGVKGTVFYLSSIASEEAVKAQAEKIKGAIVLVDGATFDSAKDAPFAVLMDRLNLVASLGAVAQIDGMGYTQDVPSMLGAGDGGYLWKLPVANMGKEDTLLLRRWLERGPVTVEFSFRNRIREKVAVDNVVGEISGTDLKDETVLIGGHLDSWNPGTGAEDNGTGAATVVGVAQAVMALGRPPRRTLRFVVFGGEEEGLLGSHAYAKAHEGEMARMDAVLITDTGSEAPKGWLTMGREDEGTALAGLKPMLEGLGAGGVSEEGRFAFSTDHADFMARGVPVLVLWTDLTKYFELHHKPSDTFDKVDRRDLALGSTTVAVTAYALADAAGEFAAHQTREQVEEQMKKIKQFDEYKEMRDRGMLF